MLINIQEEFYKTFEIESKQKGYCKTGYCNQAQAVKFEDCEKCRNCQNSSFYITPEITNTKILQIICIIVNYYSVFPHIIKGEFLRLEDLKEEILRISINAYKILSPNLKQEMFDEIRKTINE